MTEFLKVLGGFGIVVAFFGGVAAAGFALDVPSPWFFAGAVVAVFLVAVGFSELSKRIADRSLKRDMDTAEEKARPTWLR